MFGTLSDICRALKTDVATELQAGQVARIAATLVPEAEKRRKGMSALKALDEAQESAGKQRSKRRG
jgi:hypothetical protein